MNTSEIYPTALVIDDEAFMRKVLATQLRSLGCKGVICHESGEDALNTLQQHKDDIKLILCDLQMPEMDGIEVLRRLGDMGYGGSLILISGEDNLTMSMAKKLAHAHGLNLLGGLRKPAQSAELASLLSRLPSPVRKTERSRQTQQVCAKELAQGIRQGQLVNHYQPKVSIHTGQVVGMETLVRWQHPEHGLLYPDAFIGLAEEHGLIDQLTHGVLAGDHGALAHLKQWRQAGFELHVAVNVSMDSLHDLNFPNVIAQLAQDAGIGLQNLVLEITETRLGTNMRSVIDVLTRLRLKRVRLSIDDFGTGHSSLAHLQELPFDELKIDRRFVHLAHQDQSADNMLAACMRIAHDFGIETTGEGVETEADWLHLQRAGCDIAQGYWIAKPMPAEQVIDWLQKWPSRKLPETGAAHGATPCAIAPGSHAIT